MQRSELDVASEFCRLVQSADLLEYLGLTDECTPKVATEALAERRRRLQGMQSNPKYRESATYLIKHYKALVNVLRDPAAHLEFARQEREAALLPMLHLAIDSVLVDGVITPAEERFVHQSALSLGIGEDTYERVLRERAESRGVRLPDVEVPKGPPAWTGGKTLEQPLIAPSTSQSTEIQGASEHTWWDAGFTRVLLAAIPGGPGELVDVYCRNASSAQTLLPQRRQLVYMGIDRNFERLQQARADLEMFGERARLVEGRPDQLPIPDESVDYVLAIRALAYLPDTRAVLAEAVRVLRPGGRIVVAEPDGLCETFYFGRNLHEYNAPFQRLVGRIDDSMRLGRDARWSPGLALGPQMSYRFADAGLEPISSSVHAASTLKERPFRRLARQLRRYPKALAAAARLKGQAGELDAVLGAVTRLEQEIPSDAVAMCGYVLPMFLSVGVKA